MPGWILSFAQQQRQASSSPAGAQMEEPALKPCLELALTIKHTSACLDCEQGGARAALNMHQTKEISPYKVFRAKKGQGELVPSTLFCPHVSLRVTAGSWQKRGVIGDISEQTSAAGWILPLKPLLVSKYQSSCMHMHTSLSMWTWTSPSLHFSCARRIRDSKTQSHRISQGWKAPQTSASPNPSAVPRDTSH